MMQDITVLGIETSCDETAAAVVRLGASGVRVLSDVIASQVEDHAVYGGVVPEIAARAHVERLDGLIRRALSEAQLSLSSIHGVAATSGPGLIGGVMVGLSTAKAISVGLNTPLIAVNHLEGHALSPGLVGPLGFPYLLLLVSGGHCQFIAVESLGSYRRLGSTIDDAVGEAFDKTAKLLGLPQPGGPSVERLARQGDATAFNLPRPLLDRPGLDMSFSGLKTAVRRIVEEVGSERTADVCASFQLAVADVLAAKAERAMGLFAKSHPGERGRFVVAGGVAANAQIRERLKATADTLDFTFSAPPMRWCTDNAAMIAHAGALHLLAGRKSPLTIEVRARWPLDGAAADHAPVHGGGRKGARA
ncbi:tRNA (adenosine(37)-N6)-threonylcarbamoyltransferase complex transferase subunit TsaD [bacterium]|nr:tRNA (adenosine(37)-N6)-threonylcarbamoyltransferase complex transferase subunit TsaD [bacterium]